MIHTHQCRECKPKAYPSGERISENHLAVRLGDAPKPVTILLNGVDVTKHTTECIAGDEGHVWMYIGTRPHHCDCGGAVCEIERMGKVEIIWNTSLRPA